MRTPYLLFPTLRSPHLSHFINNAEHGAPRCCEVFVNDRANCNKQEWCLSLLTGTTLLIRLAWPDGTQGVERKEEDKERERQREDEGDGIGRLD